MKRAIGLAALILAACVTREVSQVPYFAAPRPPEGKALVYVLRSDGNAATFDVPAVRVDDKLVVTLHAAEYSAIHLAAGRHTVSTDADPLRASPYSPPFAFTVAPGQLAALALRYLGAPPPQTGASLDTKGGRIEMPRTDTTYLSAPFGWAFVPDIEESPCNASLPWAAGPSR